MERKKNLVVLFDLDGVIIDSEPVYTSFWGKIGKEIMPDMPNFAEAVKGRTLLEMERRYFPNDEKMKRSIHQQLEELEENMAYDYIPGAADFIRKLKCAGAKMAIVTSSDRKKMNCVLRVHPELQEWFDCILMAEDFEASKPDPDCYLKAASALGVKKEDCVVVEDSLTGLTAGRRAGMKVLGVATTLPRRDVEQLADKVIDNFEGCDVNILL